MDNTTGIVPTFPIGGNNSFLGGEGMWALLIFALIFNNGGFGFGGNGGFAGNGLATQGFVANEFTQRDIAGLGTEVGAGFQNTNNLIANLSNSVLENKYAAQLSACQTQRDIATQTNELNTNLLTTALQNQATMDKCCCDIKTAIHADGEATRQLITANTIQDLRDRLQDAQTTITANGIGNYIVGAVRPYPVPAYPVSSPYVGLNNFYGSNWYGNTIV